MLGKRFTGALLLSALIAAPAWSAEAPRLLADINTKPLPPELGGYPALAEGFLPLGGRLLFWTVDPRSGDNGILWSTDGTPDGAAVVSAAICPTPCHRIAPAAVMGGRVLLRVEEGNDILQTVRYWRTDGTPAGTFPVTGPLVSASEETFVAGTTPGTGLFYFVVFRPEEGFEVWRSDGTVAGTGLVKDLTPGPDGSYPSSLTGWAGRLYFIATAPEAGGTFRTGLWSTDGTAEGTRFIAEVRQNDEIPARLVPAPSRLLFTSGEAGEDLWATDGTPEGTRLLHEFTPRPCSGGHPRYCPTPDVNSLVAAGSTAYFAIQDADGRSTVWESDGTPGGTRALVTFPAGVAPNLATLRRLGDHWLFRAFPEATSADPYTGALWSADDRFSRAEPVSGCEGGSCPAVQHILEGPDPGHLLLAARDSAHGTELWVTDGTGAGTRRLSDACPGPCDAFHTDFYGPLVLGSSQGRAWFLAYPRGDANFLGNELWVTDGTAAGTHRVAGHAAGLGFLDGNAYFGLWGTEAYASEVWMADGSNSGTHRVTILKRIAPGSDPVIVPLGEGALIQAFEVNRAGLWKSDGTPEGTQPLFRSQDFLNLGFTRVGGLYFFTVAKQDPDGFFAGNEVWRTDGTRAGTRRVAALGLSQAVGSHAVAWKGKYLFIVGDTKGCSFWTSDGTSGGTGEIVPRLGGTRCPTGLHPFGSRFLFVARTQRTDGFVPQLFISDGTPAGTRQLTNLRGTREPLETELVQTGGTAFFRIRGLAPNAPEVWRTDGTPKGTRRAFNLREAAHLQVFRGSLYLTALNGGSRGLFRVDPNGSPVLLARVSPPYEADFSGKPAFTLSGGRLFFAANGNEGSGRELWATDGTPAGTKRVLDIQPGPGSSAPEEITAAGNRIFFAADDGELGRELWVSNGTAEGTRLVWDLNPGGASSSPHNFAVAGGNLFFAADDGETGTEPWGLRLTPR